MTPGDASALGQYFDELDDGQADFGCNEPRAVPDGGQTILVLDLTADDGHFMGPGRSLLHQIALATA
ncbi:MAG TPA: hypothetical protein VIJ51_12275 [Solirubrobacteraceae bacterium]